MTTNPVDPTKPQEVYEVDVGLRERLGESIYVAKELGHIREFKIKKQLLSSSPRQLRDIARLFFSNTFIELIALEKAEQAYLEDHPGHRFEWTDESE